MVERFGSSYLNIDNKISNNNKIFIKNMYPYYDIETDGMLIGVFHGSPDNILEGRIYPDTEITNKELYCKYDFIITGHTHHKMVKKVDSTIILNPGSIGQPRDGKGCSYLILDTLTRKYEFKRINYNYFKLIADIDKFDSQNYKLKELLLRGEK